MLEADSKPVVHVTLHGQVDDNGISDVWWNYGNARCRIVANANFLYFTGLSDFEDDENLYSVFMAVTSAVTVDREDGKDDEWHPTVDDFTPDALEYYVMDWGDTPAPDPSAFAVIDAALAHYAESSAELKTTYENRRKLAAARKAYLEANPPKPRDVIINFRPTGKSAERYK